MTREQCDLLSAPLVRTVNDMEDEILRVIAAQLAKDGNISDTSKWRIRQLARSGEMDKETAKIIARYSGLEENFAMAAIEDAAKIEIGYVDNAVRAEGLAALAMGGEASAEASAMGAYTAFQRQAKSSLNLVNTVMMYKAKQTFVNGVNKIYYESEKSRQDALNTMGKYSAGTVMGQFSLQEATRRCIKEMAAKGIPAFVDKRGREWSPEAYVMMDMRSTLGNTARAAQWARCDEYGIKLVEVSSHLGARPGCAPYQGRIFSRDGSSGTTTDGAGNKITYTPLSQTSYGKPDGLFGINCGHVQYPFFQGCSFQSYFPYPKEENAEMYKNHQKQRYYERQIRAAKRECVMLNETGDKEGFDQAAARLKRSKESYKKFTESKGLYLHNDRTQVVGFDRSVSGKATWANRKAEQAKAKNAAVKVGGVPTGGKGSSGGHAVTVTPPKDPVVGNSKKIYRDTNSGLTSSENRGKIKLADEPVKNKRYRVKPGTLSEDEDSLKRHINHFFNPLLDRIDPISIVDLPKGHGKAISDIISKAPSDIQRLLGKYTVKVRNTMSLEGGQYLPRKNAIRINLDKLTSDPRGAYRQVFHEAGHFIDNALNNPSLNPVFERALRDDFDNVVNKVGTMLGTSDNTIIYMAIGEALKKDSLWHSVSDIIGGITDNKCYGRTSHFNGYWSDSTKLPKEAFAHFFEATTRNDNVKIGRIKNLFPTAYDEFLKMLK